MDLAYNKLGIIFLFFWIVKISLGARLEAKACLQHFRQCQFTVVLAPGCICRNLPDEHSAHLIGPLNIAEYLARQLVAVCVDDGISVVMVVLRAYHVFWSPPPVWLLFLFWPLYQTSSLSFFPPWRKVMYITYAEHNSILSICSILFDCKHMVILLPVLSLPAAVRLYLFL